MAAQLQHPPALYAWPASMVCACCAPPIWMRCVFASGFLAILTHRAAHRKQMRHRIADQTRQRKAAAAPTRTQRSDAHAQQGRAQPLLNLATICDMSHDSGKRRERVCTLRAGKHAPQAWCASADVSSVLARMQAKMEALHPLQAMRTRRGGPRGAT